MKTHSGTVSRTRITAVSSRSNRGLAQEREQLLAAYSYGAYLAGRISKALNNRRLLVWHADSQFSRVTPVSRKMGEEDDTESYRYADAGTRVRKVRITKAAGEMQKTVTTYAAGCETRRRVLEISVTKAYGVKVIHDVLKNEVHLRYGFADHLGSVSEETDEAGNIASREKYYHCGGSARSDEEGGVHDWARPYSEKKRGTTGMIYYGWRCYQPERGRWLSADPSGLIDGVNLFRFCRNSPVILVDKNGLMGRSRFILPDFTKPLSPPPF